MPKTSTFPALYDDAIAVSITKLKKWGYLRPNQYKSGTLTWSRGGNTTGSIRIRIDTYADNPHIELSYKYRDKPVNYKVQLVSVPSNIGKGEIWYFLCPHTGKRCRKLYSIGERFLHREAYRGCMYESQTYSSKTRRLFKLYDKVFGADKLYEQLHSKYFKRAYAGKPTKRYLKLVQRMEDSERFTYMEKELLLSS